MERHAHGVRCHADQRRDLGGRQLALEKETRDGSLSHGKRSERLLDDPDRLAERRSLLRRLASARRCRGRCGGRRTCPPEESLLEAQAMIERHAVQPRPDRGARLPARRGLMKAEESLLNRLPCLARIEEHAERSARLINTSLGASGTAYGLLAADGESYTTINMADVRPPLAAWLATARPDQRTAFRRWRNGEGPFLLPFEPGHATPESLALAREAEVTAYAAIPIRVETVVVGGIAAYFDRPFADLHLDRTTLERIATVASISLENFRLRERSLASEQRYRSIFEASPDPILITTPEGSVVDVNEAALRMYRADRVWLLGQRSTDLARFDLETVRDRAVALGLGQTFRTRAVGVRRDGDQFSAEVDLAAVEIDGGRRYLVRVRDLTDQERLQAELVQAQKMEATGQLVSGVAHELNNPLAAILGFSQLIRRDTALPEDLRHNADLLVEEATRTRRIGLDCVMRTRVALTSGKDRACGTASPGSTETARSC